MKRELTVSDLQDICADARDSGDIRKMREAESLLMRVLDNDPDNWPVIFFLSAMYLYTDRPQLAVILLNRAAELSPETTELWNNLGTAYRKLNLPEKAEHALQTALNLSPEDADILNNLGTLHVNEGTPHIGEQFLHRALAINPIQYQAHWNLALVCLEQEKWMEGFTEYAYGLSSGDRHGKNYGNAPYWNGKPAPYKTLVVFGEQGIGDEIMFLSCLHDIKARFEGQVVVDVHPRLHGLVQRSFPELDVYPTRKEQNPENYAYWVDKHKPDYKLAMGDMPKWTRTDGNFPKETYLKPDEARVSEYMSWLSQMTDLPPVGISWVGGHRATRKDLRCMGLDQLSPLLDLPVHPISCQYTSHNREAEDNGIQTFPEVFEASKWEHYLVKQDDNVIADTRTKDDAKQVQSQYGGELEHHPGPAYDYDETAAFVAAIDRLGGCVVTVNTSLVHLCGALGVKTFVMTPSKPAWRYNLKRRDMVWYGDHIRQYRQKGEDWTPAVEEMVEDVKQYLKLETEKEVANA